MTAPAPTVCRTCRGEGYVGTVTRSWCPDCRCWCGKPNTAIGGMCDVHEREDFFDEEARAVRREDGARQ